MQTAFNIRPFKSADLKQVMGINQTCLPENYSSGFFLDIFRRFPDSFVVAEESGEIVGYAMCRVEHRFGFGPFGRGRRGHLISIAVLPDFRRRGVATALMNETMKSLTGYNCENMFLEVRVSNVAAVGFYKVLGFGVERMIRHYYADGEGAYLMARKLP